LHVVLELSPEFDVTVRANVAYPYSDDVVDESSIEEEIGVPAGYCVVFVDCEVYCCPWRCGSNTHPSPGDLAPVCISKLENVVLKYDGDGFD
jgi:hypothetical protein